MVSDVSLKGLKAVQLINHSLEDLHLSHTAQKGIEQLNLWLKDHTKEKSKGIKKPFLSLFFGKAKDAAQQVAALLGQKQKMEVYKIDLSKIVSKYIGETEKNLAQLFEKAENKNWILFFDEADALFGKRTDVKDAHDKYANQEVSYFLERMKTYDGLIIFYSDFKLTLHPSIIRRMDLVIRF